MDLTRNEGKGPSSKELVGRAKEMKFKKALEVDDWLEGEELSSAIITNKFTDFNSFLGLPNDGV